MNKHVIRNYIQCAIKSSLKSPLPTPERLFLPQWIEYLLKQLHRDRIIIHQAGKDRVLLIIEFVIGFLFLFCLLLKNTKSTAARWSCTLLLPSSFFLLMRVVQQKGCITELQLHWGTGEITAVIFTPLKKWALYHHTGNHR